MFLLDFLVAVFLLVPEPLGDSDDDGLRAARRFIQPAKGRLRAWRSGRGRISSCVGEKEGVAAYLGSAKQRRRWPCLQCWARARRGRREGWVRGG